VGWITGGIMHDKMGTNNDGGKTGTMGNNKGQWAQTTYKHRLGPTLVFFFFSNIYIFQTRVLPARTTHHPPPASRAPAREVDLGWKDGKQQGGRTMATTCERHTTRPQPYEQLLVGWMTGGTTPTPTQGNDHHHHVPPTSSPTSNCLWGGSWVE
jgi:hypothetical protein